MPRCAHTMKATGADGVTYCCDCGKEFRYATPTPSLAGASDAADRVREAITRTIDAAHMAGKLSGEMARILIAGPLAPILADREALRTRAEEAEKLILSAIGEVNPPGDEHGVWSGSLVEAIAATNARVAQLEADKARLKAALGCHLNADAYRESFPDNDQDATHDRKSETWWRLMARCAVPQDDPLHEVCSVAALSMPEVVAHRDAVIANVTQEHGA